ncbi:MAG TPA: N-acetyltransferase family protein [Clostridiales bacterium]|nr:N-acetyltransferase family protein [Clostridiales bacterium]HQP69278.1 N-acetyltransferase family protein [Clostridiales bacterium]
MIRKAVPDDAAQICWIYNYYIENTTVTFETEAVSVEAMRERIISVSENHLWLVYDNEGKIYGFAYAMRWKERSAYKFTVESTVYIEDGCTAMGIGPELYEALLIELKKKNVHAVLAGITLPNENSVKMHEKLGFKKVAHMEQTGFKCDKWIDVGYWELIL